MERERERERKRELEIYSLDGVGLGWERHSQVVGVDVPPHFEGLGGIVVGKKGHIGFEFSSAHVADSA